MGSVRACESLRLMEPPGYRMKRTIGLVGFPDGNRLVTFNEAGAVVWNLSSPDRPLLLGSLPEWTTQGVAVSSSGGAVALCGAGRVFVWDSATGAFLGMRRQSFALADGAQCHVAIGVGRGLEPPGIGHGFAWHEFARVVASREKTARRKAR